MKSGGRSRLVDLLYAAATAAVVLTAPAITPAPLTTLLFLCAAVVFLHQFGIPQRVGHLSLTMLAIQAAALVLNPQEAILVGVVSALMHATRPITRGTLAAGAFRPAFGAAVRSWLVTRYHLPAALDVTVVVFAVTAHNLLGTALVAALGTGTSMFDVYRRVMSGGFAVAFAYFALAGYLLATVLSDNLSGYVTGTIVVLLSVAMARMLQAERIREALEVERRDHQRHAATSRVVDGLLHNLRNRVALVRYAIEDLEMAHSTRERQAAATRMREAVEEAVNSISGVEAGLRTTSGAHPRKADLCELVNATVISYEAMARRKGITLTTKMPQRGDLLAPVDAPMIRDVVSNLIKNAIEASPGHGEVKITVSRGKGRAIITVADDGPGVPDDLKDRLFEPHFTTKSEGTGLGLFTSYGIVREHRGRLVYQPNPKGGAIFTVELPFGKEQLEPQSRPFGASGLQDQSVSV